MNRNVNDENGTTLRDLLYVLKRNVVFLLVIVLLCTAGGFLYANTQKPRYTATESVFFRAENLEEDKTTNNINVMRAYIDTVVDFCDEGVVIDRANFYYTHFKNWLVEENKTSGKLIDVIEEYKQVVEINDPYVQEEVNSVTNYYNMNDIVVNIQKADTTTNSKPFNFTIKYTDDNSAEAVVKLNLLVLAFTHECVETDTGTEMKYFGGVKVKIIDGGFGGVSTNLSKNKTIILFFVLGVVLGLVIIYFKNFLDNTLKTKEEVEQFTGLTVLSVIDSQGGEK